MERKTAERCKASCDSSSADSHEQSDKDVPSSSLDKKQMINSCKRNMLCDSVLTYGGTVDNLNML